MKIMLKIGEMLLKDRKKNAKKQKEEFDKKVKKNIKEFNEKSAT